jgi:hypothetical protein
MANADQIDLELVAHQVRLLALQDRLEVGGQSAIAVEALSLSDDLHALMEKAPLDKRQKIDAMIECYEKLRIECGG